MRLEADEPVHDVHAGLFQDPCPLDVGLLVEAGLQLDERDHLLPLARRVGERAHDPALGTRSPVDGLLDREHSRVAGGLLDERLDGRRERVVRVVHEDVAGAEHAEQVGAPVPGREDGLGLRGPRLVLQVGPFERVHVPQAREVEQGVDDDRRPGGDGRARGQHVEDVVGHRRVDFEANGNTELRAAVQHRLDRLEEVLGLVVELEVGVSGHPEGVVRQHLHPGEQPVEIRGDHLLEGDEALAIGERDETGERRRDLHAGEALLLRRRVPHD